MELIEYAPGVSVEKDILPYLDFVPAISPNLREMDSRLFIDAPMGIFDEWEAYKKQLDAK